jgi:hypothetical protein
MEIVLHQLRSGGAAPDAAAEALALAAGAAPPDHIAAAQAQTVRFFKALADTVWAVQQLRPEEAEAEAEAAAQAAAGAGAGGTGTGLARALALEAGAEARAGGVLAGAGAAGGVAERILALGRDLRRELAALESLTRAVPDYAAAFSDDAAFAARVNAVVGAERAGPEATLRRGVAAGERRLRNIDAVLAAAARVVLDEEPRGVAGEGAGAGARAGAGAGAGAEGVFDGVALVGSGADVPLIAGRRRGGGAAARAAAQAAAQAAALAAAVEGEMRE